MGTKLPEDVGRDGSGGIHRNRTRTLWIFSHGCGRFVCRVVPAEVKAAGLVCAGAAERSSLGQGGGGTNPQGGRIALLVGGALPGFGRRPIGRTGSHCGTRSG